MSSPARVHVEGRLQEALDSGESKAVTEATWKESKKRVQDRIKAALKKRRAKKTTG